MTPALAHGQDQLSQARKMQFLPVHHRHLPHMLLTMASSTDSHQRALHPADPPPIHSGATTLLVTPRCTTAEGLGWSGHRRHTRATLRNRRATQTPTQTSREPALCSTKWWVPTLATTSFTTSTITVSSSRPGSRQTSTTRGQALVNRLHQRSTPSSSIAFRTGSSARGQT